MGPNWALGFEEPCSGGGVAHCHSKTSLFGRPGCWAKEPARPGAFAQHHQLLAAAVIMAGPWACAPCCSWGWLALTSEPHQEWIAACVLLRGLLLLRRRLTPEGPLSEPAATRPPQQLCLRSRPSPVCWAPVCISLCLCTSMAIWLIARAGEPAGNPLQAREKPPGAEGRSHEARKPTHA